MVAPVTTHNVQRSSPVMGLEASGKVPLVCLFAFCIFCLFLIFLVLAHLCIKQSFILDKDCVL